MLHPVDGFLEFFEDIIDMLLMLKMFLIRKYELEYICSVACYITVKKYVPMKLSALPNHVPRQYVQNHGKRGY